jgi:excisionase family DNA binding protein
MAAVASPAQPGSKPLLGERLTYSVQEAVQLTGLHKITIHRAIADGKLRSHLVGRRRLIDARSLRTYVGVENEPKP